MIKAWQTPQQTLFLLAPEKQLIPVVDTYRVQEEMIETKNFVPEALMIYHFQDINRNRMTWTEFLKVSEGDKRMLDMHVKFGDCSNPLDGETFLVLSDRVQAKDEKEDGGDEDEDWEDEDDEDGDEDEDWDDDLDEDEDWDEDDEEWDDDEDEEWDDDEDVDEEEDWGDEEES